MINRLVAAIVIGAMLTATPSLAQDHSTGHDAHSGHDAHAGHGNGMTVEQAGLSDLEAIRAMQTSMFDSPDNPLDMGPVVISGDYAVSDWAQAGMGGRALLRKTDKDWGIHLCAGAGLKDAAELEKIGVPAEIAADLAAQLEAAEASLPSEQVARYDSFDGTMMVDESLI